MPVLTKINTNVIADDAVTGDKFAGDSYLENTSNQNLSGTIAESRMYTSDAYTLSGDTTVNGNLVLSSVKEDGSDITLTTDSTTRTLTGTGKLIGGGTLQGRTSLTGMSGTVDTIFGLTPTATASAPTGSQGALYYDSDKDALMQYGTSWNPVDLERSAGVKASGGIESVSGGYRYHAFKSTGSFTINLNALICDILVIAGGAAGSLDHGGGGGAGGWASILEQSLGAGQYICTIGAGGTGGWGSNTTGYQNNSFTRTYNNSHNGENSSFSKGATTHILAYGGGGGAGCCGNTNGTAGGSGGGVNSNTSSASGGGVTAAVFSGVTGTSRGFLGGSGSSIKNANSWGAGGGGAGAVGTNNINTSQGTTGGKGGAGYRDTSGIWDSWGTTSENNLTLGGGYFAGGGAGGGNGENTVTNSKYGGIGGGGGYGGHSIKDETAIQTEAPLTKVTAPNGAPNTGGGGAGVKSGTRYHAGSGGSGIIIIRYSTS